MIKILEDLKNIRRANGLTACGLSEKLGKPKNSITILESKGNPRLSTLIKIFDFLGYEIRAVKK